MNTNSSTAALNWLKTSTETLEKAGISSSRLDCMILLEDALGMDRAHLLAHPETQLSDKTVKELDSKLRLRAKHQPLAYIRGKVSFYGRDFFVNEQVLVPRPESEAIVSELLSLELPEQLNIADLGTGSGILGITAVLELPSATVDLYDISDEALKVARQNSEYYRAKANLIKSDLLANTKNEPSILLANLPYVPIDYPVNKAAKNEPPLALYGGDDGMDLYKKMWKQLTPFRTLGVVITESLPSQHAQQSELAKNSGFGLIKTNDYIQVFKRIS